MTFTVHHFEIRTYLFKMKEDAPRILIDGRMDRLNAKDGGKTSYSHNLTSNEQSALNWLVDSFVDYPLLPKTDCPHQSNDRYPEIFFIDVKRKYNTLTS